jgi:hypothetical protein
MPKGCKMGIGLAQEKTCIIPVGEGKITEKRGCCDANNGRNCGGKISKMY